MNKINVMHLRSSRGFYGAESVILSICKNIDKEKFNCFITCFKDPRFNEIALIDEARKAGIYTEVINLSFRFDLSAAFKLRALLNKYNIDILHCHDYKANFIGFIASRFRKVKLVTTIHGWTKAGARLKFYEYLDSFVIRYFDQIIVVSGGIQKTLLKSRLSPEKIVVIHNGIDADYFSGKFVNVEYKRRIGIEDNFNVIGTVGRLSVEKGQKYLIEAASEVINIFPNTVFLIIGNGPFKKSLQDMAKSFGLEKNVIFTGPFPREELRNIYSLTDIFILPSLAEGFGLALTEAMAMGIPAIATKIGGIPEIIEYGKTGYLIPPADPNAISRAIIDLLSDKTKAELMAKAGQNFVRQRFSIYETVRKTEELYRGLTTE